MGPRGDPTEWSSWGEEAQWRERALPLAAKRAIRNLCRRRGARRPRRAIHLPGNPRGRAYPAGAPLFVSKAVGKPPGPAGPGPGVHGGGGLCTACKDRVGIAARSPGSFVTGAAAPRVARIAVTPQALWVAALYQPGPPGRRRCHAPELPGRLRRRRAAIYGGRRGGYRPVEPNPPEPRPVSSSSSTRSSAACTTGTTASWATRSPGMTV